MVEFGEAVKGMIRGDTVRYDDDTAEVQIPWSDGYELPVWFAAYGPKALKAAGEAGDGLIIQLADPWLVKWFSSQALDARKAVGKSTSGYKIMSAAPVWVGDMKKAREQTRWFPAMVGNHVADIVEKYGKGGGGDIPTRLTDYIEGRKGYDYRHHADKDADHLGFIKEEIIDSFGILGPVENHVQKIKELEAAGVTQFNIYLMCGEEERIVAEYAEHVLPHFKKQAVTA
jgi:alkanesulfonate monooxygenase SsuD/methylene tetrahydromethanopterin reductase-like flavin-dependent oxidoreductase (luciferase family)